MTVEAPEKRLYKIGEVCKLADVQPYVLRYWETEFPVLSPNKSGGGQRLYSQREIDIILRIKQLLYSEGFTIAGAKKKLEADLDDNLTVSPSAMHADPQAAAPPVDEPPARMRSGSAQKVIGDLKKELRQILRLLED